MSNSQSDTETKILDAAKKVFIQKGLEGARMQEIADEAKINKALLHYYFRTKERLFSAVFKFAISRFIPRLERIFDLKISVLAKIELIVEQYISLLLKNQFIPIFILHEINRHPDRLVDLITSSGVKPNKIISKIDEEIKKENLQPISAQNLIMNILSLCVFPFAARPLVQRLIFDNNKKAYNDFLVERKKEVSEFIIRAIKA
jgi:AcrR family transcriptional regulator